MVKINGEEKDFAGKSVLDVLGEMSILPERTAVMVSGEILPKGEYSRVLAEGDEVDIIGFVGGG